MRIGTRLLRSLCAMRYAMVGDCAKVMTRCALCTRASHKQLLLGNRNYSTCR